LIAEKNPSNQIGLADDLGIWKCTQCYRQMKISTAC